MESIMQALDNFANQVTDFSEIKDHICFKLINTAKNQEMLEEIPHVEYNDLSVIFYILIEQDNDRTATTMVKNNLAECWRVDAASLYDLALKNTPSLLGGEICSIAQMLSECGCDFIEENEQMFPMYIATNKRKMHGAGVILYPGFLRKFANLMNDDFYILPSSIHECIFIPATIVDDAECLKSMVPAVNQSQILPHEVLSDNVYFYRRKDDSVTIV